MEERDLLDVMVRSEGEEGGVLNKEELADQTKTYVARGEKKKEKRRGEGGRRILWRRGTSYNLLFLFFSSFLSYHPFW